MRTRVVAIVVLLLIAGGAGFALYYRRALFNDNFHTVLKGQLYRSAQLNADGWRRVARAHSLKSVVNLRGASRENWYREEKAACSTAGVKLIDVQLDYFARPSRVLLLRLIQVVTAPANRPMLLHCEVGSDRVGLPTALALIAGGADLATAREQLSWRYGHFPTHPTSPLGSLLNDYERWLASANAKPSADSLRRWAETAYQP